MARFYALVLPRTLSKEVSVIRNWGRIGSRGQAMIGAFDTQFSSDRQAALIEGQKRRRGYV